MTFRRLLWSLLDEGRAVLLLFIACSVCGFYFFQIEHNVVAGTVFFVAAFGQLTLFFVMSETMYCRRVSARVKR